MSYRPKWNGRSGYAGKRPHTWLKVLLALAAVALAGFLLLEVVTAVHARDKVVGDPEIMVIPGCQVMPWGPSILLQDRLDKALEYLKDHPDMTVVVSGAQGGNEPSTEAQAMADYLRAHGFEGTILQEEKSFNTWQNVNYSLDLLKKEGYDTTGEVMLVSNGVHLARLGMLWSRAGGSGDQLSTLAAPMSHFPSAVKMYLREPLALVKSFLIDR